MAEPFTVYQQDFLETADADDLLENLEKIEFPQSHIKLYGRSVLIPRLQLAWGESGTSYKFSGVRVMAQDWSQFPIFQPALKRIDEVFGESPNFVLVNHYRDGKDHISWHSDDESDLTGQNIFSLSLGASRDFCLREKFPPMRRELIRLEHNSLLVMSIASQRTWQHSLPKRLRVKSSRYNLTFRRIKVHGKI